MQNQIIQMIMNQLKARNPQLFKLLEQKRQQNSDPEQLFKELTNSYTPSQKEALFNRARQFGIGDDVIDKLK